MVAALFEIKLYEGKKALISRSLSVGIFKKVALGLTMDLLTKACAPTGEPQQTDADIPTKLNPEYDPVLNQQLINKMAAD